MKALLLALVWGGIMIGATLACSSLCITCSSSGCTECPSDSYYSESESDCVATCTTKETCVGQTYGAKCTCYSSGTEKLIAEIVVPIVVVLAIVVVGSICYVRRKKQAALNSMGNPSAQPADQSSGSPNQNVVSAAIPIDQANTPGYQDNTSQSGNQQVFPPQTGGYNQNGFGFQAQAGFNQGGYQGQGVQMQAYDQQKQQVDYQQQQQP